MLKVSTSFSRTNTIADFALLQSTDSALAQLCNKFRNALTNASGFLSVLYAMSDDKLTLHVSTLWTDKVSAAAFGSNPDAVAFKAAAVAYNAANGIVATKQSDSIPDTLAVATLKVNRLNAAKAAQAAANAAASSAAAAAATPVA